MSAGPPAVSYGLLRARFLDDNRFGGPGAVPTLTRALETIGWRAVREPSPEELAAYLLELVDACVHGHRDLHQLELAIAATLRDAGPLLDGGLPPAEAYLPAAAELLARYVRDETPSPGLPLESLADSPRDSPPSESTR
jgi:hypothetical protein